MKILTVLLAASLLMAFPAATHVFAQSDVPLLVGNKVKEAIKHELKEDL